MYKPQIAMRQIKNIFIYTLVLAFVYIGAGVPLTSYCCQQKQEMKMSCCKSHDCNKGHDCHKTTILKIDNFEKASASISVTPILNLVADVFSPYSYQPSQPEVALNDDYGFPPGPDSSRHYLNLFCVLVI